MEKYEYFFFNNIDIVCFVNMEGYFEEVNESFTKILGYTTTDLAKRNFYEFIHPEDIEPVTNGVQELDLMFHSFTVTHRFNTKSNVYKLLEWNSTVNLETRKICVIAREITETIPSSKQKISQNKEKGKRAAELVIANKELEFQNVEKGRAEKLSLAIKELKMAEDDLKKLNKELQDKVNKRTAQLEFANKEMASFSYSISHDLRAPLRAINGNATILQEDYADKFDSDGIRSLRSILSNSKKMGELIDDLLAFSKLGRKEVTASEINMMALVHRVREELLAEEKTKAELNIHLLPPAKGDPSLIKQVWMNLISNGIKYSKYKPKIVIEIGGHEKDNHIVYYVRDNGVGFDMQYYDKLFGVFQRLHSNEEFEGKGIGLAIVQKIVHKHNGKIWAVSELNVGTCFYFSLPVTNF